MASSKETYCLCGQPYNIGQFMIECDCCREWFHGSCVDVKIYHSDDIDKYHCPKCSQTYGPSVLKIPTNNHRADRYELSAETRPSQVGTPAWVRALAARPQRPHPASLTRLHPTQFTQEFVRDEGFNRPVLFASPEGLDMKTPNPQTFTVRSVLRFCGAQLEVEVIDVRRQTTLRMPLIDFIDYFETPPEHRDEKVLNVLSLEFSDTNMAPLVEPPGILKRLDWACAVWPASAEPPRPAVHKYCLMSAGGSYTDFHVDFGGTTVWYHVLHGRKIFYLIPPTSTNLALYQQWSASNNQNERFFGDMVEWYGTVEITAGQTLFIPTGWIHAVLTPCDSLVFGGNLLHSYAIEMQLQIYEIERRVETPTAFRYPLFEAMHWYAGAYLLTMLRRHNEETQDEDFTLSDYSIQPTPQVLPPLLVRGIKILANALKEWHALKSTDPAKRDNVPKCLNSGQLVRELCKELRTLEKRSASTNHRDKEFKPKSVSPRKPAGKAASSAAARKALKLTLPKPIMHNAPGRNGDFAEADKFYIDNKEVVYQDNRYIAAEPKYIPDVGEVGEVGDVGEVGEMGEGEGKQLVYTKFRQVGPYQPVPHKAELVQETSPPPPPPYPLGEHSILKSHLVRERPALRPLQHWSISKRDIGDYHYHAEEHILYTNDHVHTGPGMYSAEDIQQEYEYVGATGAVPDAGVKAGGGAGAGAGAGGGYEYGYGAGAGAEPYTDGYQRYELQPPRNQPTAYTNEAAVPVQQQQLNGAYHNQLPSYDAAVSHQYTTTTNYVIEEQKPQVPPVAVPAVPVRRSERPVRRRVSSTYDYEDGDLYIEEPPQQTHQQRRKHKHRHHNKYTPSNSAPSGYRGVGVGVTVPTNGIESLIQASVLAEEPQPQPQPQSQPTDTEDLAVEGMLSIGSQYTQPARTFGLPQGAITTAASPHNNTASPRTGSGRRSRRAAPSSGEELSDEEDVIKEVHRDEEYVYPSLEMSSDEDEEWQASRRKTSSRQRHDSRSKSDKDESWSPRARLGRLVPRLRGPARAGVRRECVRAALTHAAAAPAHTRHKKHTRTHAHTPPAQEAPVNAKRAVLESKSRRPPPPPPAPTNNKNLRLKKGMKTAKQRLGKILKIHKMIY